MLSAPVLCCGLGLGLAVTTAYAAVLEGVSERSVRSTLEGRTAAKVSAAKLASYNSYTEFAGAAYCGVTSDWTCGSACSANPDFQVAAYGGDGDAVQYWYVGYSPAQNSVIVAHQGTEPTAFLSDLTDVEADLVNLNATYFPGVQSGVMVHEGFADEHALTAAAVLAAVESSLKSSGASSVTAVGHSLGGALSMLDALFLSINLPSSVHVNTILYGCPRVGNPAFATLMDDTFPGADLVRIIHASDPIPIVPGRFLGFEHPHGELHIISTDDGEAVSCSGDDNDVNANCTDQYEDNDVLEGNVLDHIGPYPGSSDDVYLSHLFGCELSL